MEQRPEADRPFSVPHMQWQTQQVQPQVEHTELDTFAQHPNVWLFLGIILVVIIAGTFSSKSDNPQIQVHPIPRKKIMTAKVAGTTIEGEAKSDLASDYVENHVVGAKGTLDDCHTFIKSSSKYQAQLLSFKIEKSTRTYMYKFLDESTLEIEEDIGSRQFRPRERQ